MRTANLSVVIANRNHARYLPRALDAVLSQSLRPREMILVDDDSTDDSVRILEGYARRFPEIIRFVRNECHRGVTRSYNRGFTLATSEYTLAGGADDFILPGFIEKAMSQFAQHPHAGMCLGFGSCTDGNSGPLIVNDPGWCDRPEYFTPEQLCRRLWHTLPVSALIRRRDALLAIGGYRSELAWYSDWFADLVIAFRHGVIHIPETLGIHVSHPGSYATNRKPGAENVRLLGVLLDLLLSPEFADVAVLSPQWSRMSLRPGPASPLPRIAPIAANRASLASSPASRRKCTKRWQQDLPPTPFPAKEGGAGTSPSPLGGGVGEGSSDAVRELAAVFVQDPWREVDRSPRADLEAENSAARGRDSVDAIASRTAWCSLKLRWAAGLVRRRLRKAVGLHPAGRFR